MRERWTDDRLDDLNGKVDALRLEMKTEFAAVRGEMKEGFDKVDDRFAEVDKRFDKVDERFDRMEDRFAALNRTLLQMAGGVIGILIVAGAGLIATQL